MRSTQLSSDVKLEVMAKLDTVVADAYDQKCALFVDLFTKQRFQQEVEAITNVFQDYRISKLDRVLER